MSVTSVIPIRSLYFMLSYAWGSDQWPPSDTQAGSIDELKSPQSLVAWWLANEHQRLARRGLVRGYVAREEALGTVRGTIDVARLARTVAVPTRLPCRYDELDHDTWLNRRVASALRLAARADFDDAAYEAVKRSLRGLGDIGDDGRARGRRQRRRLGREERHYRVALALSDIILRFAVPQERAGEQETLDFRDFSRDQRWGGALFERFVLRVIEREQDRYKPHSTRHQHLARAKGDGEKAKALLPSLRTDICLSDTTLGGSKRIVAVIETKFYATPLAHGHHDAQGRLRASHLAQLYVYLKVLAEHGHPVTTGLLIYAAPASAGFDVEYVIDGFQMVVRTVALDASPTEVIDDVLSLLGRVRAPA